MKVEILFQDGRKEVFDKVEKINVAEEKRIIKEQLYELAQTPTEGKLFEIRPSEIDRSKFEKPMGDYRQQMISQIIQEAFIEVDKYPEKYSFPFYTFIPEKKWFGETTVSRLEDYANEFGGVMADWVDQALEWAQRICNGESWEIICNKPDTAKWFRIIHWKNGCYKIIGGARDYGNHNTPCSGWLDYFSCDTFIATVPLVKKRTLLLLD